MNRTTTKQGAHRSLNPDGLHKNPAFSQAVLVEGAVRTLYIGGQNAMNQAGQIVGKGDLGAQSEQIFNNIEIALAAVGAGFEHIIKMTIYVVQGQTLAPGFAAFQQVWGKRPNPPLVSVLFVAGLAHPDFLAEIDAIAVLPA